MKTQIEKLERTACPVCGGSRVRPKSYRFDPFAVVACGDCPAWYTSPRLRPEAMEEAYRGQYFESGNHGYSSYQRQERSLKLTFGWLLGMLAARGVIDAQRPRSQPRALLEIGSAYGFLLELARPYFDELVGTDYSEEAARRAARNSGARMILGGIDDVPESDSFDLVLCTHVIEHVYDPPRFVQQARDRLKPGGWLVMTTPNMDSWLRHLFRSRWPSFKVPEHVVLYNKACLRRLLEDHGFGSVTTFTAREMFPLSVILEKFGLRLDGVLSRIPVWVPGTTIGVIGRRDPA